MLTLILIHHFLNKTTELMLVSNSIFTLNELIVFQFSNYRLVSKIGTAEIIMQTPLLKKALNVPHSK